ncbi:putative aspartate carbamoyl transferase [Mycobacterium xenopi 4042]|uniref:Putative aspartate carbamoyl transferase n=1 Tax=Mycobacterium xenopi 4042 TaxID=1299334 RepID=X7ZZF3_MYCXE|nr:putative aspartate carbamoyl transferase [Mycobacterium xenopi 4042]
MAVTVSYDLDAELPAADAVLMLRVQAERMHGGFFPSAREYSVLYGLSDRRQALLPGHAVVLHPARCCAAWRSSPRCRLVAIRCAATGFQWVHVRMAVLFHVLVGAQEAAA